MRLPRDEGLGADEDLLGRLQILQQLGEELWLLDRELRFVYVNRPVRAAPLGTSALEALPVGARTGFASAFSLALRAPAAQSCEITWSDATCTLSRLVGVDDPRGARYVLVTTRDVTAEAACTQSQLRLQSALDASGVGSWSWSMLTGALVWDARMCEIWGLAQAPASYAAYLATLHPEDQERVKALVEQFLTSGRFDEFEHRILRPSGEVRHTAGPSCARARPAGARLSRSSYPRRSSRRAASPVRRRRATPRRSCSWMTSSPCAR